MRDAGTGVRKPVEVRESITGELVGQFRSERSALIVAKLTPSVLVTKVPEEPKGIGHFVLSRLEEILMLSGALIWITGELIAVFWKKEDTTTSYVRRGKKMKRAGGAVLLAAIVGTVWLFLHFVFDMLG